MARANSDPSERRELPAWVDGADSTILLILPEPAMKDGTGVTEKSVSPRSWVQRVHPPLNAFLSFRLGTGTLDQRRTKDGILLLLKHRLPKRRFETEKG